MTIHFQSPLAYIYRDGKPVPLEWCAACRSFHVAGEHAQPKLVSLDGGKPKG